MPKISDHLENSKNKKFKKVSYRPWDMVSDITEQNAKNVDNQELSNIDVKLATKDYKKNIHEPNKKLDVRSWNNKSALEKKIFIQSICGIQKNVLRYMVSKVDLDVSDIKITNPIYRSDLMQATKSSYGSISSAILRLSEKGMINVYYKKPGVGGFTIFQLNSEAINLFSEKKNDL